MQNKHNRYKFQRTTAALIKQVKYVTDNRVQPTYPDRLP